MRRFVHPLPELPTNKNMLGKLIGTAIRAVTLPIDAANAGIDILTGGDGSKRSRTDDWNLLGAVEELRDQIAETADEIDER
jgi:hypothetical protein